MLSQHPSHGLPSRDDLVSPRCSSATARGRSGIWGQTIALRNPQSYCNPAGRGCLDLPRKRAIKYAIKSRDDGPLSPIPPFLLLLLLLLLQQKCSPCSPSRTRLLLPEPPATHRSRGTKSARGSHASGAVPEGYCR